MQTVIRLSSRPLNTHYMYIYMNIRGRNGGCDGVIIVGTWTAHSRRNATRHIKMRFSTHFLADPIDPCPFEPNAKTEES